MSLNSPVSPVFWPALLLSVLCLFGLVLYWLLFRRPWAGPRTRYPVVLVHGILGFDHIEIGSTKHKYFRGVPEHLEHLGVQVHVYRGLMTSTVPARAQLIAAYLKSLPAKRVNVIAHSMGGLDMRYAISKLDCAHKVASLTTIGTPHRGSPVADFGHALVGNLGILKIFAPLKDGLGAVSSLTTVALEDFNRTVPNKPGVHYASLVCAIDAQRVRPNPLLVASHRHIEKTYGPNDGLVPASSQAWGEVLDQLGIDHWAEVGWSNQFDVAPVYEKVLVHLRQQGL